MRRLVYKPVSNQTLQRHSSGQWRRDGPLDLLVDKSSAIQQNSDLLMPIDEDHSNLVKFGADDQNCQAIINFISSVASSPASRSCGGTAIPPKNMNRHIFLTAALNMRPRSSKVAI